MEPPELLHASVPKVSYRNRKTSSASKRLELGCEAIAGLMSVASVYKAKVSCVPLTFS